ncbi:MAG: lipid A deacylase LpxR family protein, partial [Desulfosalsimonadaceae bacterium]
MKPSYLFRRQLQTVRLLLSATVFLFAFAAAQDPVHAREKTCMEQDHRTFNVYIENDAIAGDDGQYTSGLKLTWSRYGLSALPDDAWLHRWLYPVVKRIGWGDSDAGEKALTFSVGQNIYTPDDIEVHELIEDDRPYAGFTYMELGFHKRFERYMHTVGITGGIVGPESYAEDIQESFHDILNSSEANGWDHQLKNEPVLELVYDYKRKFFTQGDYEGLGSDIIFNVGGNLGNALTNINSGLLLRYGWNIPHDFGNFAIQPATCFNAEIEEKYCQRDERRFGL